VKAEGAMGVKVRQKNKGRGQPWWVFVSHNKRRTSRMVGDKDAAEEVASNIRAQLKLGKFSQDVNRGMIKKFLLGKSNDGYAVSTITHIRDVISGVLNDAVDDEVIPANPSLRLGKFLSSGKKKTQIDALSNNEITQLLNAVAKHYPTHYTLFLLLARTGADMRSSRSAMGGYHL
jgi:integrase